MNNTNLIPASRRQARDQRRRIVHWVTICGIYSGLLLAASACTYFVWGAASVDAAVVANVRSEISHANATKAALRAQSRDAQHAMQSIQEISEQPDWSILLAAIGDRCGKDVFLSACDLSGRAKAGPDALAPGATNSAGPTDATTVSAHNITLHLSGFGRSQEAISSFVLRLQELPIFERVKLLQTGRQPYNGAEAFAFSVDCAMGVSTGVPHDQ